MTLLLAALLVASEPAVAAPQPETITPAAAAPAPKATKPKKICKSLDADTGTRFAKRVCKTEEEWAVYARGSSMEDLGTKGAQVR
ncbi:MAG TPA: hypothetical protein VF757_09285 [Sphingomicrobium sp.]